MITFISWLSIGCLMYMLYKWCKRQFKSLHNVYLERTISVILPRLDISATVFEWLFSNGAQAGKWHAVKLKFRDYQKRRYQIISDDISVVIEGEDNCNIKPQYKITKVDSGELKVDARIFIAGTYTFKFYYRDHDCFHSEKFNFASGPAFASNITKLTNFPTEDCIVHEIFTIPIELRDEHNNLCLTYNASKLGDVEEFSCRVLSFQDQRSIPSVYFISSFVSSSGVLKLDLIVNEVGFFTVDILFHQCVIKNGSFNLLCLTESEYRSLTPERMKDYFEADFISKNDQTPHRKRRIYVYLNSRRIHFRQYLFGIIPKNIASYRISPVTKFTLSPSDQDLLTVSSGFGNRITVRAATARMIIATFYHFLCKSVGKLESFEEKQKNFLTKLYKHSFTTVRQKTELFINRENLIQSTIEATKNFSDAAWAKRFEIRFDNERGLDWGGIRREWATVLSQQIFGNDYGLFETLGDDMSVVHPKPNSNRLGEFKFCGKFLANSLLSLSEGSSYIQLIPTRFSRSFLALILGLPVSLKHLEIDNPSMYERRVKYILENPVEDLELCFAEEEGTEEVEFYQGGAKEEVTDENKLRYLHYLAQYRLHTRVNKEIEAFLEGFNALIPSNLLEVFDENELELLFCGSSEISVSDMKAHTNVENSTHPKFQQNVKYFWSVVESMTQTELARLIQFITGSCRLPVAGFKDLVPNLQITCIPNPNRLPSSHTCFNELCLPIYSSDGELHRSLLTAINDGCTGFELV